jgi:2-polyprenyl-6-methoxyphenol hydroxylase-like FAD-dependent oxidoreductase
VGIVGGSIAGCAAAIALRRLGCDVTVFERSSGALRDRGSGIAIPNPLRDEMIGAGYLPGDYRYFQAAGRDWLLDDGSAGGRLLWHQVGSASTNNWGVLWRALRAQVPDECYVDGSRITGVEERDDDIALVLGDGTRHDFDIVVGADGYRSDVRTLLHPGSEPHYAGYILWRGNFPEAELTDRTKWDEVVRTGDWLTVCFEGGHGVMYPIPDFDDDGSSGGLRVNWAIYSPQPEELVLDEPTSIPPGQVAPDVLVHLERILETHFPAEIRPVFGSSPDEVSIQPIYDETIDFYVRGRVMLIGDAATVSRPHTGSGATKAMQDARLLEQLGAHHDDWEGLLAAYDADRTPAGQSLVELGRRIGRDQVEQTPPWADMTPDDFQAWTIATVEGARSYIYQNVPNR